MVTLSPKTLIHLAHAFTFPPQLAQKKNKYCPALDSTKSDSSEYEEPHIAAAQFNLGIKTKIDRDADIIDELTKAGHIDSALERLNKVPNEKKIDYLLNMINKSIELGNLDMGYDLALQIGKNIPWGNAFNDLSLAYFKEGNVNMAQNCVRLMSLNPEIHQPLSPHHDHLLNARSVMALDTMIHYSINEKQNYETALSLANIPASYQRDILYCGIAVSAGKSNKLDLFHDILSKVESSEEKKKAIYEVVEALIRRDSHDTALDLLSHYQLDPAIFQSQINKKMIVSDSKAKKDYDNALEQINLGSRWLFHPSKDSPKNIAKHYRLATPDKQELFCQILNQIVQSGSKKYKAKATNLITYLFNTGTLKLRDKNHLSLCSPKISQRKISRYERFSLAAEKLAPPFCMQTIVKGKGQISEEQLKEAVEKAAQANPASRFVRKRYFWVDSGKTPPVIVLDPEKYKNVNIETDPLFQNRIDTRQRTNEIYLIPGKNSQMIFRSSHAAMDGAGARMWMLDVFRALRGEPLKAINTAATEEEILASLGKSESRPQYRTTCISPTGLRDGHTENYETKHIQIPISNHALTARIATAVKDICRKQGRPFARVMIPVDLRSNMEGLKTTGNLISSITVSIFREDTWPQVQSRIMTQMMNHQERQLGFEDQMLKYLPKKILRKSIRQYQDKQLNEGKYIFTAFISDMGTIDNSDYSAPDFKATSVEDAAMNLPGVPVSITSVAKGGQIELILSMPKDLATEGRLDIFASELHKQLCASDTTPKRVQTVDLIKDQGHGPVNEAYKGKTINQMIEAKALAQPDAVAIKYNDKNITYKEMNDRATQLARVLRKKGAGPNLPVAIIADRSPEFLIGLQAIMKSGAAYVPIDPNAPSERQDYILKDTGAKLILADKGAVKTDVTEKDVLFLSENKIYENESKEPLDTLNKPSDLIYIIYTSGSTGHPKGVACKHEGVVNQMLWREKLFKPKGETLTWPLFTSVAFDLTEPSMLVPFISGDSVKIFGTDPYNTNIAKIVNDPEINVILGTPSHIKMMNALNLEKCKIKTIAFGGEELTTGLAQSIAAKLKHNGEIRIINEYGPTEGSINCSYYVYDPEVDTGAAVPIGKAIDNVHLYVLDNELNPVPIGHPGELFIGGVGVAQGYINRPEMNEKRFIDNPFRPGEKMFRTGDVAKWQELDKLVYAGREDDQVKINGYRIELGEVESVLANCPQIKNCSVIPVNLNDSKMLAAYYVAEGKPDIEDIRKFMAGKLQRYMIPESFTQVADLPTTINGKLDRRALPSPQKYIPAAAADKPKPQANSEIKDRITDLWAEKLKVDRALVTDNVIFSDLGGNSSSMIELISDMAESLLPPGGESALIQHLDEIIKEPTVSNMTAVVERLK